MDVRVLKISGGNLQPKAFECNALWMFFPAPIAETERLKYRMNERNNATMAGLNIFIFAARKPVKPL